jgi:hypothetical protein
MKRCNRSKHDFVGECLSLKSRELSIFGNDFGLQNTYLIVHNWFPSEKLVGRYCLCAGWTMQTPYTLGIPCTPGAKITMKSSGGTCTPIPIPFPSNWDPRHWWWWLMQRSCGRPCTAYQDWQCDSFGNWQRVGTTYDDCL